MQPISLVESLCSLAMSSTLREFPSDLLYFKVLFENIFFSHRRSNCISSFEFHILGDPLLHLKFKQAER